MLVTDPPSCQRLGEAFAVELRIGARSRHRPYIDNKPDTVLLKQLDEFDDRPRRMTYGEKDARDGSLWNGGTRSRPISQIVSACLQVRKRRQSAARQDNASPTAGPTVGAENRINLARFLSAR